MRGCTPFWFRQIRGRSLHYNTQRCVIFGKFQRANFAFLDVFRRKTVKHKIFEFFLIGIVCWNVLNTMRPIGAKPVEKLRRYYRKTEKKSENRFFCVKSDLVRGGARLHFISKRFGRPSFFSKRSHLSNLQVKSEGVVTTA